ncbi:MAG: cyclic nucleotide-binding domain-containing protein [Betaproteobacteria bacterium]|nr:cyclic nucleotide-binding domain-containing protein [Betaproteobacteria bacterium]
MADNPNTGSDRHLLESLEDLGSGTAFADQIFSLVGRSQFFAEFNRDDIALLGGYMRVYHAQPGQTIIREGDFGDYMLLIIRGEVDILRRNLMGEPQHLTSVTAGMTLGEMSMIDGEPRFATCVALKEITFGVLSRDDMVKIILEKPSLGAKILIKLVTLLSQRLRHTSAMLLQYMR